MFDEFELFAGQQQNISSYIWVSFEREKWRVWVYLK